MLHADKVLLSLLLMRIYLKGNTNESTYEAEFDHLLLRSDLFLSETAKSIQSAAANMNIPPLTQAQILALMQLSRLPNFKECIKKVQNVSDLSAWLASDNPELHVPELWVNSNKLCKIFCRRRFFGALQGSAIYLLNNLILS